MQMPFTAVVDRLFQRHVAVLYASVLLAQPGILEPVLSRRDPGSRTGNGWHLRRSNTQERSCLRGGTASRLPHCSTSKLTYLSTNPSVSQPICDRTPAGQAFPQMVFDHWAAPSRRATQLNQTDNAWQGCPRYAEAQGYQGPRFPAIDNVSNLIF